MSSITADSDLTPSDAKMSPGIFKPPAAATAAHAFDGSPLREGDVKAGLRSRTSSTASSASGRQSAVLKPSNARGSTNSSFTGFPSREANNHSPIGPSFFEDDGRPSLRIHDDDVGGGGILSYAEEVDYLSFEAAIGKSVDRMEHLFKVYQLTIALLVCFILMGFTVAVLAPLLHQLIGGGSGAAEVGPAVVVEPVGDVSVAVESPLEVDVGVTPTVPESPAASSGEGGDDTGGESMSVVSAAVSSFKEFVAKTAPALGSFGATTSVLLFVLLLAVHGVKNYFRLTTGEVYVTNLNTTLESRFSLTYDRYSGKLLQLKGNGHRSRHHYR